MANQLTKKAIAESLKHLLVQKPLDKITINDIAADCGINRMTFYYHFQDIYDLVEWICIEDSKKALSGLDNYENWQQGYLKIFELIKENGLLVKNVYKCISRDQIRNYLVPLVDKLLMRVIDEIAQGMTIRDEDKKFTAKVFSYVFIGLVLDWIMDDMRENPDKIVEKFSILIQDDIKNALIRFSA